MDMVQHTVPVPVKKVKTFYYLNRYGELTRVTECYCGGYLHEVFTKKVPREMRWTKRHHWRMDNCRRNRKPMGDSVRLTKRAALIRETFLQDDDRRWDRRCRESTQEAHSS
jgi:hypothetical protein